MKYYKKCYKNKPIFNGVYSRDNLPEHRSTKIKDRAYIINLDEYSDIRTHWVALYVQNNNVTYFNSFGVEYILKEIKAFIINNNNNNNNKNIKTNISIIQAYDLIMCGYFCIGFDFMLAGKNLAEYTNLFSPNNFKKNDDIILNYFVSNI